MGGPRVFVSPDQVDSEKLVGHSGDLYAVQKANTEELDELYLDTHDWRLHREGMTLTRRGTRYTLTAPSGERYLCRQDVHRKHPFWWNFQDETFRKLLKRASDIRALLPRIRITGSERILHLHNKSEKTVLKIRYQTCLAEMGEESVELDSRLFAEPLKGFGKSLKAVSRILAGLGFAPVEREENHISLVHKRFGIDPKVSDSKFNAQLAPDETAAQAIRDICLVLSGSIRRNLPGTREDIDSEFLHDLRVSVRRTRSVLSLLKKYFPSEECGHFKTEFKWLGSVTGPVRDLDVYLLKTDEYRALLPNELYPGLECFFQSLKRQRQHQLQLLRENLDAERFLKLLPDWEKFLIGLPERDFPEGRLQCRTVAEKIIRKRMKRILKNGRAITADTPEENLHQLRIEGKKIRYILEFFRSLFNEKAIDAYLKQMKKLQKNLGDFNDLSVQKEMLAERLAHLEKAAAHSVETAAALGGLIVHLSERQQEVRRKFEHTFTSFATKENTDLLESIFESKQRVAP